MVEEAPAAPTRVVDLIEALQASIDAAKTSKPAAAGEKRPARRTAAKTTAAKSAKSTEKAAARRRSA